MHNVVLANFIKTTNATYTATKRKEKDNGGFQRTIVLTYLFPEQHKRFQQRPADRKPSLCSWMDLPEAVTVS